MNVSLSSRKYKLFDNSTNMKHFYTKISTMVWGLMAWSQVQGSDYVVDFTVDGVNYAKTSDTEVMIVGADKYGKKTAHPDFSVADLHRPCMTA